MTSTSTAAADLAAAPGGRNRYVDFVRVLAIAVVIVAHWLLVLVAADARSLTSVPGVRLATWLQVLPLFFAVGGFAHARALDSLRRRGGTYGTFVRSRVARLLPPVLVFLAVWVALATTIEAAGWEHGPVEAGVDKATSPLWFIGVYLVVVLCAPVTYAWHRRYGLLALAALALAVVGLDALGRGFGWTWAGAMNLLVVWLTVHQFGFLWSDGLLEHTGVLVAAVAGGFGTAVAVTFGTGWYPVLMVGLPGDPDSNLGAPNLALLAHAVGFIGLALLFRGPATFCWHLTAAYLVQGSLMLLGARPPRAGSAAWWPFLPLWMVLCSVPLAGLVRVFRRFEHRPSRVDEPRGNRTPVEVAAGAGLAFVAVGLFVVSQVGLDGLLAGRADRVLSLHLVAWPALALIAVGLALRSSFLEQLLRSWKLLS